MSLNESTGRRDFLRLGAAAMAGATAMSNEAALAVEPATEPIISPGSVVLFQGDSITDAGRKRGSAKPNDHAALGNGYAMLAAAQLAVAKPDFDLRIFNRGISGNKVHQLSDRWQADCLDLAPDVLSILIGVNDIWHRLNGKYDGDVATYRADYDRLLERTKAALPNVKLVVCEPFVLKVGAVDDRWFPEFDEFRATAKDLADKFADAWVPFQTVFDRATTLAEPTHWAHDGVHPSPAGAALMASAWCRAVVG